MKKFEIEYREKLIESLQLEMKLTKLKNKTKN